MIPKGSEGKSWKQVMTVIARGPRPFSKVQRDALAEGLSLVKTLRWKSQALCGLAPLLPPELMAEALAIAGEIANEQYRVEALNGLASYLPSELKGEAMGLVGKLREDEMRMKAMIILAAPPPPQ